jgi:hypothetical protein
MQISQTIEDRLTDKQLPKYRLYVGELGKVLHLLLMLAGRLARAENDIVVCREIAPASDASKQFQVHD